MLKRYRVMLHGQNFRLAIDGIPKRENFVTTRFVDASDEGIAAERAKSLVWKEFANQQKTDDDPPTLEVLKINQTNWFRSRFRKQAGYTFYGDEGELDGDKCSDEGAGP